MKLTEKKYKTYFLLILSTLIFATGCKSKKTIAVTNVNTTVTNKANNTVIEDVISNELKFTTLYAKGNVEFKTGGSSNKFGTLFRIEKDKAIQASVRPFLGVEALSLTITPDSILILDRLNKKYVAENIKTATLSSNFDFNFYNLQALFTNKLFVPGQREIVAKDMERFKITSTPESNMLQTKDKNNLLYSFAIDATDRIASTIIYSEERGITIQSSYGDFINDNAKIYPTSIATKVEINKQRLDLNISYDKLEVDKQFQIEMSIPSRYKKVSINELMSSYMKMK